VGDMAEVAEGLGGSLSRAGSVWAKADSHRVFKIETETVLASILQL
jgi:hypothetical protein